MKNKFRILISLLFLFFTTQSFSSPIQKINFIGLNNLSEESILQIIPFQVGQTFDDTSSNLIIESLFKTGLFSDISITKTQDNINITLKENPTIKYFDFELDSGSGFSRWLKGEKMLFTNEILNDEIVEYTNCLQAVPIQKDALMNLSYFWNLNIQNLVILIQ